MEVIAPPSWKSLTAGAPIKIEWPYPDALDVPSGTRQTYWRDATVVTPKDRSVVIELTNGSRIEVVNLRGIRVPDKKDKTSTGRSA